MVAIIGDEEAYYLAELALLELLEGELKATVFLSVVGLDGNLTLILQASLVTAVTIDHREVYDITIGPTGGIKGACTKEDAEHVEYAVVIGMGLPTVASA